MFRRIRTTIKNQRLATTCLVLGLGGITFGVITLLTGGATVITIPLLCLNCVLTGMNIQTLLMEYAQN